MPTKAQTARNRLAVAARLGDTTQRENARADLAAAKLEQYVSNIVADCPPLTQDQREAILAAFVGIRVRDAA